MMIDLNDDHDLEVHEQELKRLDYYRKESAQLRDEGYKIFKEEPKPEDEDAKNFHKFKSKFAQDIDDNDPHSPWNDPWEILDYVRLIKVLLCDPKIQLEQKKELLKTKNFEDYFTKKNIANHPLSVKLAAQALQILTIVPGHAFSKPALLCWYWIIREIFTAERPDWSIGGTRAGTRAEDEYCSSAFITIACVDALQSFAVSYEYTGKFFGKLGEIQKRLKQLNQLKDQDKELLKDWQEMEKIQIVLSGKADLLQYWQYFALSINGIEESDLEKIQNPEEMEEFILEIFGKLPDAIRQIIDNFADVKEKLIGLRYTELSKFPNPNDISSTNKEYLKIVRTESAHRNAVAIFNEAIELAKGIIQGITKDNQNWDFLQKQCNEAAKRVRLMLQSSVKKYFESVIDQELSNASLGITKEWDQRELICAATGYSSIIEKPDEDERLSRAITQLCKEVSVSGQFSISSSFYHVVNRANYIQADNSIFLNYFARLIRTTKYRIEYKIVKYMLSYFDAKKVEKSGWCNMFTLEPRHPDISSTTTAIEALTAINEMLDERINNIVLEHFSVKMPEDINIPTLDSLFYPDYGLCQALKDRENKSISQTFYRMRLHVSRLSLTSQDQENLHSLVLYGPPGTGKTTFIESLAKTCNVPLVEVTPSDIIKEGEAFAEKRARTVFEALSLLTRVVILFDEFDPVLRRRDPNSRDLNVFSFLTPGMLPKLKTLHDSAKKRSVAYVLATNLIGTLDEAAIRRGRFDEKLGIFPPDLLSRTGRFISQAKLVQKSLLPKEEFHLDFVIEVMKKTIGAGMSSLAREGWFTCPKDLKKHSKDLNLDNLESYIKKDSPLYQVFAKNPDINKIEKLEPEEELNFKGNGKNARTEYLEWAWIKLWDDKLKSINDLSEVLETKPTPNDMRQQISESYYELPDEMKESDFKELKKFINSPEN